MGGQGPTHPSLSCPSDDSEDAYAEPPEQGRVQGHGREVTRVQGGRWSNSTDPV